MASTLPTEEAKRRGLLARVGICALNLLFPGLGLMRLARYGQAIRFFLLVLFATAVLLGSYLSIEQMEFDDWVGIIVVVGVLELIAILGSIISSWRASKWVLPRIGIAWKWYGILAVWAVSVLATLGGNRVAHDRYHAFYIPAGSMLPTLQVNDRIMADMHAIEPIRRGDVVIVHANGIDYVKRVAALPGDSVALVNGTVVLNGKPVSQQFVEKTSFQEDGANWEARVSREQFPGEAKLHLVMDTGQSAIDNLPEITLPPDRYFLLGDNRDHSADSRMQPGFQSGLGLVSRSEITGRIAFRYWRNGVGIGPGN